MSKYYATSPLTLVWIGDERRIYPELCKPRNEKQFIFPEKCPICGASLVLQDQMLGYALYMCGGTYLPKSQIQTHTDVCWGFCYSHDLNEGKLRKE